MSKPAIYKAAGILCLLVFAIGVIVSCFLPVADTWLRRTMWSMLEASPLIVAIWFFQLARQLNRQTDSRD
jgi:anaerobic C4-dicarboxylate transporter